MKPFIEAKKQKRVWPARTFLLVQILSYFDTVTSSCTSPSVLVTN